MSEAPARARLERIASCALPTGVSGVSSIAFLPGGDRILVGTGSRHYVVYDRLGRLVRQASAPFCPRATSPSPDGTLLVACGESSEVVVHDDNLEVALSLSVTDRFLNANLWLDAGDRFAVAGETGRVHEISMRERRVLRTSDLSGPILALAVTGDGALLASTYSGRLYRLGSGEPQILLTAPRALWSVTTAGESWLAGGDDGQIVSGLTGETAYVAAGAVAALRATPHGAVLALCHDDSVRALSPDGAVLHAHPSYPGWAATLAVDAPGTRVAHVEPSGGAVAVAEILWDGDDTTELHPSRSRPSVRLANRRRIAVGEAIGSPDGRRIATDLAAIQDRIRSLYAAGPDGRERRDDHSTGWALAALVLDACAVHRDGRVVVIPHSAPLPRPRGIRVPRPDAALTQRRIAALGLQSGLFSHLRVCATAAELTSADGARLAIGWAGDDIFLEWDASTPPGDLEAAFPARALALLDQFPPRFVHDACRGELALACEPCPPRAPGLLEAAMTFGRDRDATRALRGVEAARIPLVSILAEDAHDDVAERIVDLVEALGHRAVRHRPGRTDTGDDGDPVALHVPVFGSRSAGWQDRAFGTELARVASAHRSGSRQRWLPVFASRAAEREVRLSAHLQTYDSLTLEDRSERDLLEILSAAILADRARF
ncbi:WD40 repeat domain-containing protein [Salinarimonas ramus]|uniref:WD40 repeat domain-containing protein n=1 Tax=Salinarimonas ramus TaxID=690164 RepID=A0A917Q717_9HYPH|nr:WD40 repeat domain-containing protein [Salinarimonas ramus]GGK32489.1 hypothetical protein GCM10011322_19010 [Salinarimonas ramus]